MVQRLPIPATVAARMNPATGGAASALAQGLDALAGGFDTKLQAERAAQAQIDQLDHAQAMEEKRQKDQALYLQVLAENAKIRGNQVKEMSDYQRTAGPGGAGYTGNVKMMLERDTTRLDEMIGDNETVRQMLLPDVVSYNARTEAQADLWQQDQSLKFQGQNLEVFKTESSNALLLKPTAEGFKDQMGRNAQVVNVLDVNADDKARIKRDLDMATVDAFMEGLFQNGQWQEANKLIESGFFNGYVEDMAPWLNRVTIEQERDAQRIEREAVKTRQAARDDLRLIDEKLKAGVYVPPSDIAAAVAAGKAAGMEDYELYPYGVASIKSETNKAFADATPAQIDARRAELKAKIDAGKATEADQVEYNQLGGLYDNAVTRTAQEQKALVDKGPDGLTEILARTNTGDAGFNYQTRNAISPGLGHIGMLRPSIQQQVIAGEKAMEADKTLKPSKAPAYFSASTSAVRRGFADLSGVERAANAYYVNTQVTSGNREWNPVAYEYSITAASGGAYDRGTDTWKGGIQWNKRKGTRAYSVWLPDGWTLAEFRGQVGSGKWLDGANAVYANGQPAQPGDIRDNYVPVWDGYQKGKDGKEKRRYVFFDARGNALKTKTGGNAVMLVEDQ